MKKTITIAVDAMGGDNSPKKIIDGISIHYQNSKETNYKIFGDDYKNILNETDEVLYEFFPESLLGYSSDMSTPLSFLDCLYN